MQASLVMELYPRNRRLNTTTTQVGMQVDENSKNQVDENGQKHMALVPTVRSSSSHVLSFVQQVSRPLHLLLYLGCPTLSTRPQ